jgi:hypothetical protein
VVMIVIVARRQKTAEDKKRLTDATVNAGSQLLSLARCLMRL